MMPPLARLRLQLTAWYAGVFTLALVLLGAGLFLTIRRQMSRHLDKSLRAAAGALERAAQIRETERAAARGAVVDAVDELHIPDRSLYLLDAAGGPITPAEAPAWVRDAARTAVRAEHGYRNLDAPDARELRLYAERFTGTTGTPYIAVVVAGGGYLLVRKSAAPIERSMEHMRRFVGDAAHELRTPIAILRSQAEVALEQPREAARDAKAFQSMERETARLGRIVGDLLTLARADAGERPIAREPLYLDDVAAEAVDAVRALAEHKRIQVEVGTFEEAKISADGALVRQLLLIVLDNAIKYTPDGGHVRLDVSARNGAAAVVVTDTGAGIAPEQLPLVFERFWRGEPAGREVEGAGLGLAIARWIADVHGARIELTARPGAGTRVAISFPTAA